MSSHQNRGRVNCAPIIRQHGLLSGLPANLDPQAYIYVNFPAVPSGIMVRVVSTGALAEWTGRSLRTLDQRKASAALANMTNHQERTNDDA